MSVWDFSQVHPLCKVNLLTAVTVIVTNIVELGTSNKHCSGEIQGEVEVRYYQNKWEEFSWLELDEFSQGAFVNCVKKWTLQKAKQTGGAWITKPFKAWKMPKKKEMWEHSKSEQHRHACVAAHQVQTTGTIITQFHRVRHRKQDSYQVANSLHSLFSPKLYCSHNQLLFHLWWREP